MLAMSVSILTDSAASLPAELAASVGVTVVPLLLTLAGDSYHDGALPLSEVMRRVGDGAAVTTSGPTPGEFADALESVPLDDGAVVLTVASTMSGTWQSASIATKVVDADVRLVDTGTAAGAEGLVVLAAARAAAAGASLDEVERVARDVVGRVRLLATVENLDRLAASGRVPDAVAMAGRWIGLNPVFEFRAGHARPRRPALGRSHALDHIVAAWRRSRPRNGALALHVAALHAVAEAPAHELLARVRAECEPVESFVGAFSPVMVVHTGDRLVGLAWWWDEAS